MDQVNNVAIISLLLFFKYNRFEHVTLIDFLVHMRIELKFY